MEILGSFAQYMIILILLAAVAVGGVFTGRMLRRRKDASQAAAQEIETKE